MRILFLTRKSLIPRLSILAGMAILLLLACQPVREIAPHYILPQIEPDSFILFYPPEAYEKQIEGKVILRLRIEKEGNVSKAEVLTSSGYDILDNAALEMARTVRFTPGLVSGEPRALWITWPIVFELTSKRLLSLDLLEWRRGALEYQSTASAGDLQSRQIAQRDLLRHYVHLANRMVNSRSVFPNRTIMDVVTPDIRDSWVEYQDVWPLTFVLFQDYIQRYPDSESYGMAEDHLVDYLMNEVFLLKQVRSEGTYVDKPRLRLLNSLTQYLQEHYPGALRQN
ncbi:MAG: energy transducer TonB [Candidatus Neomarinimicrobiota bacterium]